MLSKKAGNNERIGAPGYQHHNLALAQAGAGCGRALGICGSREEIQLVLLEEGGKIGAVEQDRDLDIFQPCAQCGNGLLRGKGFVIAKAVFGFGAGMGGCDLRYKGTGAKLPPQQGDIIAQQLGERLLRAAQISLSRWG